jgi:protein phosphatase
VKVRAAATTDIGRVREGNEDSYLLEDPIFAVADGMGGHRGGEVASRIAVETLERLFREGGTALAEQVQEANRAVFERSTTDRSVAGMGTTLTVAIVQGESIRLAHVGDSRAYLLRDGELRMLTEDHTLVHRMVKEGEISQREAERHPQRSVLTRALGVEGSVQVDQATVDVLAGDRVMLCTDGLTSMIGEEAIARILTSEPDPQRAAELLVRAANQAGGADNTTVVLLDFEDGATVTTTTDVATPARRAERHDTAEDVAAPRERGRGVRWIRLAVVLGLVVVVVAAGLVGLRTFLDSQWYVGVSNGRVAIFNGIPTEVVGFELHEVAVETRISASEASTLVAYRDIGDGITVEDREAADALIERIEADVAAMGEQNGGGTQAGGGTGGGTGGNG